MPPDKFEQIKRNHAKAHTCAIAVNPAGLCDTCWLITEVYRLRSKQLEALEFPMRFGSIDGDHHRAWLVDQMVRALTGPDYERWVAENCDGEDGPATYSWPVGVPP